MPIYPITGANQQVQMPSLGETKPGGQPAPALDSFGQILGQAIDSLSQKDNAANEAIAGLAAGEDVELHQVMLAMQEADIAFQLALQVRNKLVEAYQEVMRIQI